MKPLRIYTAFHGNLDFSALPESDRATVIARCYWPLLSLPEERGIRLGFEMSARTLQILDSEDPEWVKRFRGLAERGLVEPIASGRAQIVAPLVPTEINRLNLKLGTELYQQILGFVPETYFVNEQTWSDGLAPIYREAGARRIVMEWNNPAAHRPELKALRCHPARLRSAGGDGPVVIWNDSVVFQKVQRVAHGEIPAKELHDFVGRLATGEGKEALCLYGGDVEIFDYRPSRSVPRAAANGPTEIERLLAIFETFAADPRFEFVLPREIVEEGETLPEVALGSSEDPIPCKKQPRYNPTRWAVSGRDGLGMNTRCHELLRTERAVRRCVGKQGGGVDSSALVDLWRSDFRTRATEEKIVEFESMMGLSNDRSRSRLEQVAPALGEAEDILVSNPGPRDWTGMAIEIPLRLAPGRYFSLGISVRRGAEIPTGAYQVEVTGRHRDGSIREANLVMEPFIPGGSILGLALIPLEAQPIVDHSEHEVGAVGTDEVVASFLSHRGGAIEALTMPKIGPHALLGTIPHGYFDEIAYTPDFYSGHVIAVSERNEKQTDLKPSGMIVRRSASGPVRITLESLVESPFGPWRKLIRVYRNAPRLDLVHELSFHEASLASLRLGTITLLPEAWDRSSLRYGTVNGGAGVEWRSLASRTSIAQSRAVSASVSASSCLGATEGWVAFADRDRGVVIMGDRAEAAVVPLLDFEEVDGSFFCRLSHTAAESDETRATFLRGRRRFAFSIEGFRAEDDAVHERARLRHHGLIYRTEAGVGISSGI